MLARPKKLDYYTKAKLGILPISFSLFLYLMITDPEEVLFSDWFIDIVIVPNFFGSQMSGASYGGRAVDAVESRDKAKLGERIGTLVGVGCGLIIAALVWALKVAVPYTKILDAGAYILRGLGFVGAFGGLGNRLGQNFDEGGRPLREKRAMGLTAILGWALGATLFAVGAAGAVTLLGVSTFLTGGLTIPILAGIVFATTFSNTCASCVDYASKAYTYVDAERTTDPVIKNTVKTRVNEYRMAFAGVGAGVLIGAFVIGAVMIAQPYLLVGAVGLLAAAMIMVSCVAVMGAIFSRFGRIKDVLQARRVDAQAAENNPRPDARPAPGVSPSSELAKIPAPAVAGCKEKAKEHAVIDNGQSTAEQRDRCSATVLVTTALRLSVVRGVQTIPANAPLEKDPITTPALAR
jgi:hypothetical protein